MNAEEKRTIKVLLWSIWHLLVYQFGRFALGAWFALVVAVAIGFAIISQQAQDLKEVTAQNHKLIIEGKARDKRLAQLIGEQTRSRVRSCKKNYESFNEVFRPFIPKMETPQTRLFHKTIKDLKSGCVQQTKPRPLTRDFPH